MPATKRGGPVPFDGEGTLRPGEGRVLAQSYAVWKPSQQLNLENGSTCAMFGICQPQNGDLVSPSRGSPVSAGLRPTSPDVNATW